jgi:dihydroxy-acid dehydratase
VRDGDRVTIDADARRLDVDPGDGIALEERTSVRPPPDRDAVRGVLFKYAALVSCASRGAVTTPERRTP